MGTLFSSLLSLTHSVDRKEIKDVLHHTNIIAAKNFKLNL